MTACDGDACVHYGSALMLPSFDLQVIERKIKDIKAMGFTHVILPPISRSADPQGEKEVQ